MGLGERLAGATITVTIKFMDIISFLVYAIIITCLRFAVSGKVIAIVNIAAAPAGCGLGCGGFGGAGGEEEKD